MRHCKIYFILQSILQPNKAYAIMPLGKMIGEIHYKRKTKSLGGGCSETFLFRFGHGGLIRRLVTDYLSLSNHLTM